MFDEVWPAWFAVDALVVLFAAELKRFGGQAAKGFDLRAVDGPTVTLPWASISGPSAA